MRRGGGSAPQNLPKAENSSGCRAPWLAVVHRGLPQVSLRAGHSEQCQRGMGGTGAVSWNLGSGEEDTCIQ